MFDLEQSIAQWRKQMLAAGVKAPVPLEELENHLRDEIERQMETGLNAQVAFEISKVHVGQPEFIKSEFKKIEGKNLKRALLLTVGWLAACFILVAALVQMELDVNLFNWSPKWDWRISLSCAGVLAGITAIWFLARAARGRATRIVSLFACLFLVWIAIRVLPAEQTDHSSFLGRSASSPFWFRSGIAFLLCVPGIFWFLWERRRLIHRHDERQANPYATSS